MKISIVIPCFNQRDTITGIVSAARALPQTDTEIIVVDDGSNDGTRTILKSAIEAIADRVIYHGLNRGKGSVLRDGFAAATGDIILVQAPGWQYHPEEYFPVLQPILTDKADAVFASRFIGGQTRPVTSFGQLLGAKLLTLFSNICGNLSLTDVGICCKAFRASVIKGLDLWEERFGIEPEIMAKLARAGCRIYEVAASDQGPMVDDVAVMRVRDIIRTVYAIAKYNLFTPRPRTHFKNGPADVVNRLTFPRSLRPS